MNDFNNDEPIDIATRLVTRTYIDRPAHAASIVAREEYIKGTSIPHMTYRAVCSCTWKGRKQHANEDSARKARDRAEYEASQHYDFAQLDAEHTARPHALPVLRPAQQTAERSEQAQGQAPRSVAGRGKGSKNQPGTDDPHPDSR
jgi:hypothetical protein